MTFDLFGTSSRRRKRKRNDSPLGLTPLTFDAPREKRRRGNGGGLFGLLGQGAGLSRAEKRRQKAQERKLRRELARQRKREKKQVIKREKESRRWLRRQAMQMRSGSSHRAARQLMLLANAVGVTFGKDESAALFDYATEHTEANYNELLRATFIGRRLDEVLEPYHIPRDDGDDEQDRAGWIGAVAEKYSEWTRTQNVSTSGRAADELIEILGATPEEIKSLERQAGRGEIAQLQRERGVDTETARQIREERVQEVLGETARAGDAVDRDAAVRYLPDDQTTVRSTNRLLAWMGGVIARLRGYG